MDTKKVLIIDRGFAFIIKSIVVLLTTFISFYVNVTGFIFISLSINFIIGNIRQLSVFKFIKKERTKDIIIPTLENNLMDIPIDLILQYFFYILIGMPIFPILRFFYIGFVNILGGSIVYLKDYLIFKSNKIK